MQPHNCRHPPGTPSAPSAPSVALLLLSLSPSRHCLLLSLLSSLSSPYSATPLCYSHTTPLITTHIIAFFCFFCFCAFFRLSPISASSKRRPGTLSAWSTSDPSQGNRRSAVLPGFAHAQAPKPAPQSHTFFFPQLFTPYVNSSRCLVASTHTLSSWKLYVAPSSHCLVSRAADSSGLALSSHPCLPRRDIAHHSSHAQNSPLITPFPIL